MILKVCTQPFFFVQVQLFRWVEKDDGVQELQTECGYHGHILALHMQVNDVICFIRIQIISSPYTMACSIDFQYLTKLKLGPSVHNRI